MKNKIIIIISMVITCVMVMLMPQYQNKPAHSTPDSNIVYYYYDNYLFENQSDNTPPETESQVIEESADAPVKKVIIPVLTYETSENTTSIIVSDNTTADSENTTSTDTSENTTVIGGGGGGGGVIVTIDVPDDGFDSGHEDYMPLAPTFNGTGSRMNVRKITSQYVEGEWEKVFYDDLDIDNLGEWDSENSRFIAKNNGYYFFFVHFGYHSTGTSGVGFWGGVFKNGLDGIMLAQNYGHQTNDSCPFGTMGGMVYLETGDYLEVYTSHFADETKLMQGNPQQNNFSVFSLSY